MLLALTLLALVAAGLLLAVLGYRGRMCDHAPHCRSCGFDLTGVLEEVDHCPECGVTLVHERAVRWGTHLRRPWMMVSGVVLLLLGLAAAVPLLPYFSSPAWMARKPAWLLEVDISRGGNDRSAALVEFVRRLGRNEVDDEALTRIARLGLALQADASFIWEPIVGTLIENALERGLLTDQEKERYIRGAVDLRYGVHERVNRGSMLTQELRCINTRGAAFSRLSISVDSCTFEVEDPSLARTLREKADTFTMHAFDTSANIQQALMPATRVEQAALGEHRGTARIRVRITSATRPEGVMPPIEYVSGVYVRIFPENVPTVETYLDPPLRARVEKAISIARVRHELMPAGALSLDYQLRIENLEVPIIGRLMVRAREHQQGNAERTLARLERPLTEIDLSPSPVIMYSGSTTMNVFTAEELKSLPGSLRLEFWIEPDIDLAESKQEWKILGERIELGAVDLDLRPAP
ncbi:MAG TPA: hypothetical protein VK176_05460 [Phycisphaerales bacterium]|nr:hypothetical protein [Phycisphaerales bacterium]